MPCSRKKACTSGTCCGCMLMTKRLGASRGSVSQVVAFGLGLLALLVLSVVRMDLLAEWEASLPREATNRFVINIQPQQVTEEQAFFREHGMTPPAMFPMVRGRLVAINDKPVSPEAYQEDRARLLIEREFNLSSAAQMQSDNEIVAGQWRPADNRGEPQISMEEGIAKTQGVHLGDRLSFEIAGERVTTRVTNLR